MYTHTHTYMHAHMHTHSALYREQLVQKPKSCSDPPGMLPKMQVHRPCPIHTESEFLGLEPSPRRWTL